MRKKLPVYGLFAFVAFAVAGTYGSFSLRADPATWSRRDFVKDILNATPDGTNIEDGEGVFYFCKNDDCTILGLAVYPPDLNTAEQILYALNMTPDFVDDLYARGFRKVIVNRQGQILELKIAPRPQEKPKQGQPAWWRDRENV